MTQAVRSRPFIPSIPAAARPLTGRDVEVATLVSAMRRRSVLSAATRRLPSAGAVIVGPAGAGRSRLATAVVEQVRAQVGWITATSASAGIPLGAFVALLPEFAPAGACGSPQTTPAPRPDGARLQGMATAMREHGTTLLVVDDAHLLDEASATLLHHLVLRCGVSALVTLRLHAPAPDAVTALWKDGHLPRIDLDRLDRTGTRDVVETALGGQLERRSAARLWEQTRGDLVLLHQLVADEVDAGRLVRSGEVWLWTGDPVVSPRMTDLLDARVGPVPAAAQEATELVATAGSLAPELLIRLAGAGSVEAAEQCGLLAVDPDESLIRLTLPLYGAVLMARAGASRRMRMRSLLAGSEPRRSGDSHDALTEIRIGATDIDRGRLRAAARRLRDVRAVLTAGGATADGTSAGSVAPALACALAMLGDAAGATEALRHGAGTGPEHLLAAAWTAAAAGSVTEAIALAHRAAVGADTSMQVRALHAAVRFGDPTVAQRLAELADEPLATTAAAHAAAVATHDGAALDAVSIEWERLGAMAAAADASAQAAAAHSHRGLRFACITSSARAAELAQRCGGAMTPALRAAARPLPLTPREREVVTLAAAGRSNRQIAERLVVSVRTVEGHLYRAGNKLHAGTRSELVALIAT